MVGERRAASSFHEAVTRKDLLRGAETWEQVHGSPVRYTDRHPLCPSGCTVPSLSHSQSRLCFSVPSALPHEGLIPETSTEAPVIYPLSSDAKKATTSATSMGMVGEGQAHCLRSGVAILPHNPKPHQSLIPL